jgi:hypothetical protein
MLEFRVYTIPGYYLRGDISPDSKRLKVFRRASHNKQRQKFINRIHLEILFSSSIWSPVDFLGSSFYLLLLPLVKWFSHYQCKSNCFLLGYLIPNESDLLQQKAWNVSPPIDIQVLLHCGMPLILAGDPLIMRGVLKSNISLRRYYSFSSYHYQSKECCSARRH